MMACICQIKSIVLCQNIRFWTALSTRRAQKNHLAPVKVDRHLTLNRANKVAQQKGRIGKVGGNSRVTNVQVSVPRVNFAIISFPIHVSTLKFSVLNLLSNVRIHVILFICHHLLLSPAHTPSRKLRQFVSRYVYSSYHMYLKVMLGSVKTFECFGHSLIFLSHIGPSYYSIFLLLILWSYKIQSCSTSFVFTVHVWLVI
mmetsp:Transcript_31171/g.41597  ORF Transcript_31171/g.41597 Transcript_31171/m.41597 type:complete len:200 (+) Transcript_31171:2801-3400(+)